MFAYADDKAISYIDYSDTMAALDIVERWSAANRKELNKKKCGVLSLHKKSMPLKCKRLTVCLLCLNKNILEYSWIKV